MVQITREIAPVKKTFTWLTPFLILVVGLALTDLAYLNYLVVWQGLDRTKIPDASVIPIVDTTSQKISFPDSGKQNIKIDDVNMNQLVQMATASLTQKFAELSQTSANKTGSTQVASAQVKEYYIPLGTGGTASTDWVDLPGAEAYVVPANYGRITGLYFEAGIRIPTGSGRVYARLRNVTDNIGLIESEVSQEGTNTGLVSSGKIPVPASTKLYRVQLKSSLGVNVSLDNARIKLFVD